MVKKYRMEFTLHAVLSCEENIRSALAEFADGIHMERALSSGGNEFIVRLDTGDPTLVFDVCSRFGRIKCIKVEER